MQGMKKIFEVFEIVGNTRKGYGKQTLKKIARFDDELKAFKFVKEQAKNAYYLRSDNVEYTILPVYYYTEEKWYIGKDVHERDLK